jgi:hypothetical protein
MFSRHSIKAVFTAGLLLGTLVLSGCLGAGIVHLKEDRQTHFSVDPKFRSHLFGGQQSASNPNKSEITAAWGSQTESSRKDLGPRFGDIPMGSTGIALS